VEKRLKRGGEETVQERGRPKSRVVIPIPKFLAAGLFERALRNGGGGRQIYPTLIVKEKRGRGESRKTKITLFWMRGCLSRRARRRGKYLSKREEALGKTVPERGGEGIWVGNSQ